MDGGYLSSGRRLITRNANEKILVEVIVKVGALLRCQNRGITGIACVVFPSMSKGERGEEGEWNVIGSRGANWI